MTLLEYIKKYPLILEKGSEYYLFSGIINELPENQLIKLLPTIYSQEILKKKILEVRIRYGLPKWSQQFRKNLFNKLILIFNRGTSYRHKESIAKALTLFVDYLTLRDKKILIEHFINSEYVNNRKRAYQILKKYWFEGADKLVLKAWENYEDLFLLPIALDKMPDYFINQHNSDFIELFNDEDIEYDFSLKKLRNQYFGRTFDQNKSTVEKIKKDDPVSYLYILLAAGKRVDFDWAYEFYKKNRNSRSLARTLGKFGLWEYIINKGIDPRNP